MRWLKLGGPAILAFSAKALGAVCMFGFHIYITKILGTQATGLYFTALAMIGILGAVARLGLDNAGLRFAAIAYERDDQPRFGALYQKALLIGLSAAMGLSILAYLLADSLPFLVDQGRDFPILLQIMIWSLIPFTWLLLNAAFLTATSSPALGAATQNFLLPAFLLTGALALGLMAPHSNIMAFGILYPLACMLGVLLSAILLYARYPAVRHRGGQAPASELLQAGMPLMLVTGITLLMLWTDVLMLSYWTDAQTVGTYSIIARISQLVNFSLTAINAVMAPKFASLYADQRMDELRRLAVLAARASLAAAGLPALIILVFADPLLALLGPEFPAKSAALRILMAGQIIAAAVGSVGYLLMMTGHGTLLRNSNLGALLFNIVASFILVPRFGATGAAIGTSLGIALLHIFAYAMVWRHLGINTLMRTRS